MNGDRLNEDSADGNAESFAEPTDIQPSAFSLHSYRSFAPAGGAEASRPDYCAKDERIDAIGTLDELLSVVC